MLITLFIATITSVGWSFLIDFATESGNILEWWYEWSKDKLPKIYKPLGGCIYCTSPYLSVIIGLLFGLDWLFILSLVGASHLGIKLIHKIEE
jgi:hypothetical protein